MKAREHVSGQASTEARRTRWSMKASGLRALITVVLAGILLGGSLCTVPFHSSATTGARSETEELYLRLAGPNDGEPINSRWVELEASTNYKECAWLRIDVNGTYYSSDLLDPPRAARDPVTGALTLEIVISLDRLPQSVLESLASPDAPPLRVTATLCNAVTLARVTQAEWRGYVGRPWLEVRTGKTSAGESGASQVAAPPGKAAAVIHPMTGDMYLFVFESTRKDLLAISPENSRIFRETRMVLGSSCDPARTTTEARVVFLDQGLDSSGRQVYAVLWTYDPLAGWKRSPIATVPRP